MTCRPTAGMSFTTVIPRFSRSSAGPTPESRRSCGVPTVPALRMTSLFAPQQYICASREVAICTPTTRGGAPGEVTTSEKTSFFMVISVATIRFSRFRTLSVRYAVAVELPEESLSQYEYPT